MIVLFTGILIFFLGIFTWSARRDHDALLDASVETLYSLEQITALFSPIQPNDISKRCKHLLDIYDKEIAPLNEALKKGKWKLQLLGYENIIKIFDEHDSIINDFHQDLATAKLSENPDCLDKYYNRTEAIDKIKEVQNEIQLEVQKHIAHPYRSKICRILWCFK